MALLSYCFFESLDGLVLEIILMSIEHLVLFLRFLLDLLVKKDNFKNSKLIGHGIVNMF